MERRPAKYHFHLDLSIRFNAREPNRCRLAPPGSSSGTKTLATQKLSSPPLSGTTIADLMPATFSLSITIERELGVMAFQTGHQLLGRSRRNGPKMPASASRRIPRHLLPRRCCERHPRAPLLLARRRRQHPRPRNAAKHHRMLSGSLLVSRQAQ